MPSIFPNTLERNNTKITQMLLENKNEETIPNLLMTPA